MGISLRSLQTLFTARGTSCGQFIRASRLNYAATLLRRRAELKRASPLSEVAYACRDVEVAAGAIRPDTVAKPLPQHFQPVPERDTDVLEVSDVNNSFRCPT
jgi:hypothetical protein